MSRTLPILCAGSVVRNILSGTQTQDRRPVCPMRGLQSTWLTVEGINRSPRAKMAPLNKAQHGRDQLGALFAHSLAGQTVGGLVHDEWSPLGWVGAPWSPGDVLYVRETWMDRDGDGRIIYAADIDNCKQCPLTQPDGSLFRITPKGPWRPSIHMPKWAARIHLRVMSVGVERVNAISEDDARAEGCASVAEFAALWDRLYGAGSMASGAWCWVTKFERVAP